MISNLSAVTGIPVIWQRAANVAIGLTITVLIMSFITKSLGAQTVTVLHAFNGSPDGSAPLAVPIQDSQGNFYGTTSEGGTLGFGQSTKWTRAARKRYCTTSLEGATGPLHGQG